MKKILQIAGGLQIGGAEKVARDICLFSDPTKYEMHYIVFGDKVGEYERELAERGCKIFHWQSPSNSYPAYLNALRDLIRSEQYYAVHAHTMFNSGWAMMVARRCGVPVRVVHSHSALCNGQDAIKRAYEEYMRKMILHNATDLIACGEDAGNRLFGKTAFKQRGKCILNGVDTESFEFDNNKRSAMRAQLGLNEAFVIGHVGHLTKVKNQSFLIELMPKLLRKKKNAKLLMLGEGEDRLLLERKIRTLGLSNSVIMTGNVQNVPDYLNAMDVFVFPSLYEGMPLSVVEVQANGLPCVLSTCVPKDVFLTDLVCPLSLEKMDEWVDTMCRILRREPEKYAEELKAKGFDTESVMQKLMEIYDRA